MIGSSCLRVVKGSKGVEIATGSNLHWKCLVGLVSEQIHARLRLLVSVLATHPFLLCSAMLTTGPEPGHGCIYDF